MDLEDDSLEFLQAQLGSVNEMLSRISEDSISTKRSMTNFKKRLEKAIEEKTKGNK